MPPPSFTHHQFVDRFVWSTMRPPHFITSSMGEPVSGPESCYRDAVRVPSTGQQRRGRIPPHLEKDAHICACTSQVHTQYTLMFMADGVCWNVNVDPGAFGDGPEGNGRNTIQHNCVVSERVLSFLLPPARLSMRFLPQEVVKQFFISNDWTVLRSGLDRRIYCWQTQCHGH